MASALASLGLRDLISVQPGEIFRDAAKLPGHYSMLIRTIFQATDRTLTDDELTAWSGRIVSALQALGGVIRA